LIPEASFCGDTKSLFSAEMQNIAKIHILFQSGHVAKPLQLALLSVLVGVNASSTRF
jgi:hypothetical protein